MLLTVVWGPWRLFFITTQPLRAVRVLFSPMVFRWAGGHLDGHAVSWKKFVQTESQKLCSCIGGVGVQGHGLTFI